MCNHASTCFWEGEKCWHSLYLFTNILLHRKLNNPDVSFSKSAILKECE
jgi:hypothetical protein